MTLKFIIKQKKKKNGKHAVYLRLTHNRLTTTIKTDIDVFKNEWHIETGRVMKIKGGSKNYKALNIELDEQITMVRIKVKELGNVNDFNVSKLRELILNKGKKTKVLEFWSEFLNTHNFNSIFTKRSYINAFKSFKKFNKDVDFNFDDITINFLNKYSEWQIMKGNLPRGFNTNINIIKSIYNRAITKKVALKNNYPFGKGGFVLKKKYPEKRSLSEKDLKTIKSIKLTDKQLILTRKLFLTSYHMGGISFIDLCKLKYKNLLDDGFIEFNRNKTNGLALVKVTEELNVLLNYFKKPTFKSNDYVFDLITNENFKESISEYNKVWQRNNISLAKLGEKCNLSRKLTAHVSRHSFATMCNNNPEIPNEYIKTAMGHSSYLTTEKIYTNSYSKNAINKLNINI